MVHHILAIQFFLLSVEPEDIIGWCLSIFDTEDVWVDHGCRLVSLLLL